MSDKKLYECRYEVLYYAMVENEKEAASKVVDVSSDDPFNWCDVNVTQFDPETMKIDDKWGPTSGVYGTGNEWVSLEDAIRQMVERKKMKDDRQLELPFMEEA